MQKIRESKIAEIKNKASKPIIYNGKFPFNDITDREFEVLSYDIFKERIKFDDKDFFGKFDKIDLMSGVGEKGFDCTLYYKGKINGLIQCKKYKTRLTKPQIINEFLKFVLHAIINPNLIPNKNNFTYYFITSTGFANTAIRYLSDFNRNIINEDLNKLCSEIASKYELLKNINIDDKIQEIKKLVKDIKVNKIIPEDLNLYLQDYPLIAKTYFKIFTATDNTLIENIITTYLDPILNSLKGNKIPFNDHKDFSFRFKTYLSQALNRYSSAQTLVFGNQQKKIEDYYYPLTLTCKKESDNHTKIKTYEFSDNFIPKYKKVLICDQGGMGKSTILKWLFRSCILKNKGIPIFIELRSLSKKNTIIDEITMQLEPLNVELEKSVTRNLISQGNFIFFLDGYDEISKKNKTSVTGDLTNFIAKADNNLFIITSRPEDALKTFGNFQEFSIDRLKTEESYELIKKIGNNNAKSIQLISQLKSDDREELIQFLESPLLISLLYKKFEHRETIPLQKQEFYWEVFEALFQAHDIIKGDRFEREKESGLSLYEFHKILRGLGYFTALLNQLEFNYAELERYIKKSNNFFPGVKFDTNKFILDIISNVPIFQKEGLKLKWAHKTLQEYFASEFICRDTKENQGKILNKLYNGENSKSYFGIIDMCYEIDYKSFRKHILYQKCKEYSTFYKNFIIQYKNHKNFDIIVQIANYQFDSKIIFFKYSTKEIIKVINKLMDDQSSLEKHFECKIKSIEFIIGYAKNSKKHVCYLNINKEFPLKTLLFKKKDSLISINKIKSTKSKSFNIKYETQLDDISCHILPKTVKEIVENNSKYIVSYSNALENQIYNIKNCEKLIQEVEKEKEKEKNTDFFFQGMD
ncbi:NACHT domain-containing protein [uncultured Aquimarina sp.]|uniref:NACHT domain-containing protein n=1 Tax=uncultured Aquimarina sp. TaxID=575652 RepID=UPI0026287CDA|nr:NACHT domain-containing protein [uncultured Aquimarina sp.]